MAFSTLSSDTPASHSSSLNAPTPPSLPPDEFDRESSPSFRSSLPFTMFRSRTDRGLWSRGFSSSSFRRLASWWGIQNRPKTRLWRLFYRLARQRHFVQWKTQSYCHSVPDALSIQTLALTWNPCNRNSQYVAVKIKTAKTSEDNSEQSILSYLSQQRNSDWMSRHVITLLDCFQLQGSNGKQLYLRLWVRVFQAHSGILANTLMGFSRYSPIGWQKESSDKSFWFFASCTLMASSTEIFTWTTFYLKYPILLHIPWRSWSMIKVRKSN